MNLTAQWCIGCGLKPEQSASEPVPNFALNQRLVCTSRARRPRAACLSLQDGQGSGSASDQARESGNAQPPLPQEDNVEMADASLLPVTDGVAGGASTRGLSGLHSAPDPLLDSWGDAPPSRDS